MVDQSKLVYAVAIAGIDQNNFELIQAQFAVAQIEIINLDGEHGHFLPGRTALENSVIGIGATKKFIDDNADLIKSLTPDVFLCELSGNPETDGKSISARIIGALIEKCTSASKILISSVGEVSDLRISYDKLQRSSLELDRYLSKHALVKPQTLFAVPKGTLTASLTAGGPALDQPLPHDPYGLCAIGLQLASSLTSRTSLEAELHLGSDVAHRWSVRGPHTPGQLLLTLPVASTEEFREPRLLLKADDENREPIELSLAEQRTTREWTARLGETDLQYPLALALDFAPPGTRTPLRTGQRGPSNAEDGADSRALLLKAWSTLAFRSEPLQHDWQLVVAEDGTLQAHPLANAMTVVHLDDLDLQGIRRLRAEIRLAHEQAPRIGFAMALVSKDKRHSVNVKDVKLGWAAYKTSWFELNGKAEGSAVMDIHQEKTEGMSLALVTVCLDKRAEFAWARWGSIVLER